MRLFEISLILLLATVAHCADVYPNNTVNPWNILFRYRLEHDDENGAFGASLQVGSINNSVKIAAPWTVELRYPQQQKIKLTKVNYPNRLITSGGDTGNVTNTLGFSRVQHGLIIGAERYVVFNFTGTYSKSNAKRSTLINGPTDVVWRVPRDFSNPDATLPEEDDDTVLVSVFNITTFSVSSVPKKAPADFQASMDRQPGGAEGEGMDRKIGPLTVGSLIAICVAGGVTFFAVVGYLIYRVRRRKQIEDDLHMNPSYGL